MKTVLVALACLGAAVGIAMLGLIVIAFTTGQSVADGERAAVLAAGLDLLLWVGVIVAFWFLSRSLPRTTRILSTVALGVIACVALGVVFMAAIVLLNR